MDSMPKLKVGDKVENAVWTTGDEPPGMVEHYKREISWNIAELCCANRVTKSDIEWSEMHPMDDQVPDPPDHVQGSRVRLLVGEAMITGELPAQAPHSFVANLEHADLVRLRRMTRNTWRKHFPERPMLSNLECDEVIDTLGPDSAVETMRVH